MKEQHSNSIIVSACPEKQNKKRSFGDDMENFTFNTGCKRALLDQNYNQAPLFTAGLSCQPVAVQFKHPEAKENIIATGIYHSSVVKLITSSLPFQEKKRSLPLEAVVQLYQEDTKDATMVSNPTATPILYDLRLSSLPGLIDACNFVKPDPDLIQFLNFDYRLAPHLMYAVAKLHTGAIVYTEDKNLLLLTCEGYCRSKSADAHAETSKKSIPIDKHSIFIGICDESDGHGAKSKLKIGGYHMNILSTMSADVGLELDINIGPSTDMLPAAAFSIVYPEENVTKFKEIMAAIDDYDIELNINHVRQLVSGFGNVSTYKPYRASMDLLEKYETLMPATVFNLCDFPGNEKYGVSDSAVSMLASRFLNVMASDTSLGIQNISKARFNDAIMTFNANYKSQASNKSFDAFCALFWNKPNMILIRNRNNGAHYQGL